MSYLQTIAPFNNAIYSAHIFACFFMTGLIWLVQLIHYPSYQYINRSQFETYQHFHTTTITYIVGPIMILEIATGMYIFFDQKMNLASSLNMLGLILIWLATLFFSVPKHAQLSLGYDIKTIESLISTNWGRTIIWSLRSGFLLYFMAFKK